MANYAALISAIQEVINTNGNNEITGALLQQSLLAMISSLGANYQFVGVATPSTNPGTPDQNVAYIAGNGTYPNFNNTTIPLGSIGVFTYSGSWTIKEMILLGTQISDFYIYENASGGVQISTTGRIANTTTVDKATLRVRIPKGNIQITIPKCGNQYNAYYGLSVGVVEKNHDVDYFVAPAASESEKVLTFNNTQYNYLYICYVPSYGLPSVLYSGILLGDDAVLTRNIADGAVTEQKVGNGAVTTSKLGNGAVTEPKIADGAVTIRKLNLDIFYSDNAVDYRGTIAELYVSANIPSSYDLCVKCYNNNLYVRPCLGTTIDIWRSLTNISTAEDGRIYPLLCTTSGGGVTVGDTIGYIIFKDVATFKARTTSVGAAEKVYKQFVTNVVNSPEIFNYLVTQEIEKNVTDLLSLNEDITAAKTISGHYVNVNTGAIVASATRSVAIFPFELNHTYKFNVPKTGSRYSPLYAFMTDLDQTTGLVVSSEVGNEAARDFEIKNTNANYIYIAIPYTTSGGAPTCVDITELPEAVKTNGQKISELNAEIEEIQEEIAGGLESSIDINVPDVVFAVVGDTLQLYYESIFKVVNPFNYDIKVNCNIGAQYPRYFQVLPTTSQIGDYQLGFIIKNYSGKTLGEKTVTLRVVNCISSPASQLNVLCVGASTTNGGEWVGEMKKRLTTASGTPTVSDGQTLFRPIGFSRSNIAFVGRKEANDAKFEATGGFNYNSYLSSSTYRIRFNFTEENAPSGISEGDIYTDGTSQFTIVEINIPSSGGDEYGYISCTCPTNPVSAGLTLTRVAGTGETTLIASSYSVLGNPFVFDGQIDIQRYANEYCGGRIDVVFAYLFANGIITPYQTNFASALASMQSFISMFTAVFPNCKFGILVSQNKDARGGLGTNYGASASNIWTYEFGMKVSNHNLITALQNYITENSLSDSVFIVNNLNEFDYMNDYRQTTKIVNPRSPVKEVFGLNGVHPSTVGYYQIADSATRLFVAKFCQ